MALRINRTKTGQLATNKSELILVMYPFSTIDTASMSAKTSQAPIINIFFLFTLNFFITKGRSPITKVICVRTEPMEVPILMSA